MPFNKSEYDQKYIKDHVRRVVLGMQYSEYERLKTAADAAGEPVATFAKKAIRERIERLENNSAADKKE